MNKTAEEILIKHFKEKIPEIKNLNGFVYTKTILKAMQEFADQQKEIVFPTEEEVVYLLNLQTPQTKGFYFEQRLFGAKWAIEQVKKLNSK